MVNKMKKVGDGENDGEEGDAELGRRCVMITQGGEGRKPRWAWWPRAQKL
jgi:hypothetical protein